MAQLAANSDTTRVFARQQSKLKAAKADIAETVFIEATLRFEGGSRRKRWLVLAFQGYVYGSGRVSVFERQTKLIMCRLV